MIRTLVIAAIVVAAPHVAAAYPQFQPSEAETCSSCHLSPAGGGLLGENGLATAETMSSYGGKPEAAHGALVGPSWLTLGGDFRAGAGLNDDLGASPAAFPMQAEMIGAARTNGFTLYATLGAQMGSNSPQSYVEAREHYVMWQQHPDDASGLYVRIGRFMPVFGLRFAEHNDSTRRFGQTPLYGETYGAAVEYIDPKWEVHVTGFVHDPIQDTLEPGNGAALYSEARIGERAAVGLEGRYAHGPDDARTAGGVTAKYWLPGPKVLFEIEGQAIHQTFAAGGKRDQLVSYVMASWFVHDSWMLDLGLSQYDEDLSVKSMDIEAFDANLHWFTSSHWELLLTNRIQTIAVGAGGPTSGYSLFQFHYRL